MELEFFLRNYWRNNQIYLYKQILHQINMCKNFKETISLQ